MDGYLGILSVVCVWVCGQVCMCHHWRWHDRGSIKWLKGAISEEPSIGTPLIMRSLAVPVFSHAIPIGLRRLLITRYASHLPKSWDITNLGQVHEPEDAGTAITGTIRIGKAMHGDSRRNWSRFLVPHTSDGSVICYSFSIILLHCDCLCSLLLVAADPQLYGMPVKHLQFWFLCNFLIRKHISWYEART